jgi:ferrous iron transport protein B
MSDAALPLVALIGSPNCGKTSIFNSLTGARQKVANYAGVTVERKEGVLSLTDGRAVRVLDLPGTYSLNPSSPDEAIVSAILSGQIANESIPDAIVAVVDATNLRRQLRLVLALKRRGLPMLVALNMIDVAKRRGLNIDTKRLSDAISLPVIESVGLSKSGTNSLRESIAKFAPKRAAGSDQITLNASNAAISTAATANATESIDADHLEVKRILEAVGIVDAPTNTLSDKIDRIVLHPVAGLVILAALMFIVFQAVFAWSKAPMDAIKEGVGAAALWVNATLPESLLRSLLTDGILAGVGSVLVFLPQILILFAFILALEDSGYLPRAAFLLDQVMGRVGLSGRSFIPLLSSFACAIPGIMATRTIGDARDRWVTIMIAPLMTCSARLPVYALLIGAFIPQRTIAGWMELQGLVLFALYVAGIVSALAVAWVMKRALRVKTQPPLMMELPAYHWPHAQQLLIGLYQRATIFLKRVGGVILALMILLWALSSFPGAPDGAKEPAIYYSVAGYMGRALEVVLGPIGFNWQISIALIPGMAAREVAVGALGTVYALSGSGEEVATALTPVIASTWGLPTALALLAWYVFAPQCLSTLAAANRETGGWRAPLIMAGYLFALAYVAAGVTFYAARALLV